MFVQFFNSTRTVDTKSKVNLPLLVEWVHHFQRTLDKFK